jgi:FkbM family methyltransferase
MKKLGDWIIPEYDNPDKLKMVIEGKFQCDQGLLTAFKYVKKFDNAIDVGAWIGDSSVIMARQFKHVNLFEPVGEVADCCHQNLVDRKIKNYELFRVGLSNKSGKQTLVNKGKSFSGWISTVAAGNHNFKRSFEIDTELLDNYKFKDIDFIKIDVDSHEGFLLEGAVDFFKNNSPVIMIESKEKDQQKYQNPLMIHPIMFLEKIGYKVQEKAGKADYILTKVNI